MNHVFTYSALGNIIALVPLKHHRSKSLQAITTLHPNVDQILIYAQHHKLINVQIYNKDLSPAQQCGNGLRALAYHLNLTNLVFQVSNKYYDGYKINDSYWINMGAATYHSYQKTQHSAYHRIHIGNEHAIFLQSMTE